MQEVKAIAVVADVKLESGHRRSDSEIAAAAESALEWHSLVPADRIQVKVERGWVTLRAKPTGTTSARTRSGWCAR